VKKKILYQSDSALAKTGFGRNTKALLSYLYKTGKYEIVSYCCGNARSAPTLQRTPWKSIGTLPDDQNQLAQLNKDPGQARMASYGAYLIDEVVKQEKPDVYIAVQDIWGVDFAVGKPWFDKINSVIWTTLDSLPILPTAVDNASKIKNYWIWSNFATKALHEKGHTHVKTVHGCLETKNFYRLTDENRKQLRANNGISDDTYIVGFVFRNQLRKSVPNLLEGFKKFQADVPKAKLLLHTHWGEGWNIHKLADEHKISKDDILTTYYCGSCYGYKVKPFTGQEQKCDLCGAEKTMNTTNVGAGVSEVQLNEIYNLMDVYCHPFTSGGQEIPIQEAKLTELITLVTDYSCGEEQCEEGSGSIPLEWNKYVEHQTEFIKASTCAESIYQNLLKVYYMPKNQLEFMGKMARQWVIDGFSVEVVGKIFEDFIDNCEPANYDFEKQEEEEKVRNFPDAFVENIPDDSEWILSLYKKILNRDNTIHDDGYKYWMQQISNKTPRKNIEDYFRKVAKDHNDKNFPVKIEDLLDKEDEGKRILYIMPDSQKDVFLITSLFKSLKEKYPDYNLYVSTKLENFPILWANEHIHKLIPYSESFDNVLSLEGIGESNEYFTMVFAPYLTTQRHSNYIHNMKDVIDKDYLCTF
jgi:glycosyltransferase involved in cell wall biosynthesis|tara:strand:- start:3759 stop:5675 length:1917 start_codon:yes stop_codon:yes gene_type:complete